MKVVQDDLWFCEDCLYTAVNGKNETIEGERLAEVEAAVAAFGKYLVNDYDPEEGEGIREFSWSPCDCCGSHLGGSRHRFAVLGPEERDPSWIRITLSAANMGPQTTPEDFNAWFNYVCAHIGSDLGICAEVHQFPFSGPGFWSEDKIDGTGDGNLRDDIERWLGAYGWEGFCSERAAVGKSYLEG